MTRAFAAFLTLLLLSPWAVAQQAFRNTGPVTAPTFTVAIPNAPTSLSGNGVWTSQCMPSGLARAFDVFAATAAAATLKVQRWGDASCTYPVGGPLPAAGPLALTTGGGCPGSTACGDVGANDGQPFMALSVILTDTSGSANAVTTVVLMQGAE